MILGGCSPELIDGCASTPGIDVICGLEKPEDLAHITGTPWILISELGSANSSGNVSAFRIEDHRPVRLQASFEPQNDSGAFPVCGPPPEHIRPRGFHLATDDQGVHRLLLVNAGPPVRIERYRVDTDEATPRLYWEGCVTVPDWLHPNDVASFRGDSFVISHMYTPPMTRLLRAKMFLRINTGYAALWRPGSGWEKVPGSDVAFANGIEADPRSGRIFVAATYGETLTAMSVDGGNKRTVKLSVQPDNLTWSDSGNLVTAGHTGIAMLGTSGCRNMMGTPCSFPFSVLEIDPERLDTRVIFEHDEGLIPGASVALAHAQFLFLGTVFGDRVSRVTLSDAQ
jgi:hypothetical protein